MWRICRPDLVRFPKRDVLVPGHLLWHWRRPLLLRDSSCAPTSGVFQCSGSHCGLESANSLHEFCLPMSFVPASCSMVLHILAPGCAPIWASTSLGRLVKWSRAGPAVLCSTCSSIQLISSLWSSRELLPFRRAFCRAHRPTLLRRGHQQLNLCRQLPDLWLS